MFKKIKSKINQHKLRKINVVYSNTAHLRGSLTVETSTNLSNLRVINPCRVGFLTYFGHNSEIRNAEIGRYCSIGKGVTIGLYNHPLSFVTTHPIAFQGGIKYSDTDLFSAFKQPTTHASTNVPVRIGHDVWIGHHAMIKSGLDIGHGAIIGAGAVVTKNVPPYAIVGGNPARVINFRFETSLIEQLLYSEWWLYDVSQFISNKIAYADVDIFLNHLDSLKTSGRLPKLHPECWRLDIINHSLRVTPDGFLKP